MKTAKPSDWQWKALPSRASTISLDRSFSSGEIQRIQCGLIPEEMEDKWFIYWETDRLFFHRSWTGFCIYVVRFVPEGESHRMVEAKVNRDPEEYREQRDEYDARMISYLIDVLLLEQAADFPSDDPDSPNEAIRQWSQVGRAILGRGPRR